MTCRHKRTGIVTSHPNGYPGGGAHAAESVCSREECIQAAAYRVQGVTGMPGVLILDADRMKREET